MPTPLVCTPRMPPAGRRALTAALSAGTGASEPGTSPSATALVNARREGGDNVGPGVIGVVKNLSWGAKGALLTTDFMDNPSAELRRELLRYLNMWSERANVQFTYSTVNPQVRIARLTDPAWSGYWSYLGRDILGIPKDEPTMNLEAFTMRTPQREFLRVVCHEAGHTLGFPHEHMRRELVQRIDPQKAYPYFQRTDGWTKRDVDQQVLTPLNDATMLSTPPDQTSIMCYQLPGEIMKDGKPILGGFNINPSDHAFAALIYPKPAVVKKTVEPVTKKVTKTVAAKKVAKKATKAVAKKATKAAKAVTKKATKSVAKKAGKTTAKKAAKKSRTLKGV